MAPAPETSPPTALTDADRDFIIDVAAVLLSLAMAPTLEAKAAEDGEEPLVTARRILAAIVLPPAQPPVPAPARRHAAGPLPHEELPPSPFEQLEMLLLRSIHTPDIWAAARTRIFTELCGLSDKEEKRLGRRS